MQLFYQPDIPGGVYTLDPEESRHCIKVLRKKVNDTIDIVDGQGTFYKGLITQSNPSQTGFEIIEKRKEPTSNYTIHLAVTPTKRSERMEWLVEKITELGIDRISFIQSQHSERRKLRLDRIRRKAVSAMKQSLRATVPQIDGMIPFGDLFSLLAPETNKYMAHLSESAKPLSKAATPGSSYCILIGPEGDFSKQELQQATASGFETVTLGTSRLRTETAAIAAVIGLQMVNW
ncbi:MAG: ribosomal RNA small subunit methyltransferase E [Cyclobacteriaceae bacterium]|nr:MAG: ribosomal RNA small subunit methyltransferase E [Cyclobacteriaceae bacterium]